MITWLDDNTLIYLYRLIFIHLHMKHDWKKKIPNRKILIRYFCNFFLKYGVIFLYLLGYLSECIACTWSSPVAEMFILQYISTYILLWLSFFILYNLCKRKICTLNEKMLENISICAFYTFLKCVVYLIFCSG